MTRKAAPAAEPDVLDPASLFRSLAGRKGMVLAVSGGADSTALMLLVSRWRERPPVLVVSVDHGLRPEAAGEARLVAENSARVGLPCRVMAAAGEPNGNLQDWARRARYACLTEAARAAGFDTIVTAHHEDDQAETFLLRLARGSGVYGLAAMREEEALDCILLARPLLGVSRAALLKVAAESGLQTVADPSNADLRYDRVRMRALMPALAEHGLDKSRLAETAGRLGRAAKALDHYASAFLRGHFQADAFGVLRAPVDAFGREPEEVELRALARVLKAAGGAEYTPPLANVEALHGAILALRAGDSLKRTLAGVIVSASAGKLSAGREWGRSGQPDAPAGAGSVLVWDQRFRVEIPERPGTLSVGPLGRAERPLRLPGAGQATLTTLPGLYQDGTLAAVPRGIVAAHEGAPLDLLAAECIVGQRLGLTAEKASGRP